jgi:hypothetical protein
MKTVVAVIITALATWFITQLGHGVQEVAGRKWMISSVKVPGSMAIREIQEDIQAGRYDLAKAKLDAFQKTWQRFSSGPDSRTGAGIGDIMTTFSTIHSGPTP